MTVMMLLTVLALLCDAGDAGDCISLCDDVGDVADCISVVW